MTGRLAYNPDYDSYPGEIIEEYLEALGISARELARRCGRSAKMISELIAGKAPLEPETALQLERVLEVDAKVWLAAEANHRLRLACEEEANSLSAYAEWARTFPLTELQRRGHLARLGDTPSQQVRALLSFFGVGSVPACREKFTELASVAYRHSPSFTSDDAALLAWLRIGEIKAKSITTVDYSRTEFLQALRTSRVLTLSPLEEALPHLQAVCARAGVAVVVEQSLNRVALSGVSRWLSPRRALIQQTLRHKTDDHFWFTFFHEAAHLLLHSRKFVFIDGHAGAGASEEEEAEANAWAANFLVPELALSRFVVRADLSEAAVRFFATEQGVAPGVIVGQLQHRRVLPFSQLNALKQKLNVDALAPVSGAQHLAGEKTATPR